MAVLRYSKPGGKGTIFVELEKEVTVIGRSKDADLTIDDNQSSRQHCQVRKQPGGGFVLVDLGSKNGTFVNGSSVSHWSLKDGDLIAIGSATIMFRTQK